MENVNGIILRFLLNEEHKSNENYSVSISQWAHFDLVEWNPFVNEFSLFLFLFSLPNLVLESIFSPDRLNRKRINRIRIYKSIKFAFFPPSAKREQ